MSEKAVEQLDLALTGILRDLGHDPSDDFEAVQVGQLDVEQHEVGAQVTGRADRLDPPGRLPTTVKPSAARTRRAIG